MLLLPVFFKTTVLNTDEVGSITCTLGKGSPCWIASLANFILSDLLVKWPVTVVLDPFPHWEIVRLSDIPHSLSYVILAV